MRASFFVLLLLALVNPSVPLSDTPPRPMSRRIYLAPSRPLGEEESASPFIRSLANATINWHNNQTNAHIVLSNVTGGNVRQLIDRSDDWTYFVVLQRQYVLYIDGLEPKPNCKYSFAMKHYVGGVDDHSPSNGTLVVNSFREIIPA